MSTFVYVLCTSFAALSHCGSSALHQWHLWFSSVWGWRGGGGGGGGGGGEWARREKEGMVLRVYVGMVLRD